MIFATSYQFNILDVNGELNFSDYFVFDKDSIENRMKTKEWFEYVSKDTIVDVNFFNKFLTSDLLKEVDKNKRVGSDFVIVNIRNHFK